MLPAKVRNRKCQGASLNSPNFLFLLPLISKIRRGFNFLSWIQVWFACLCLFSCAHVNCFHWLCVTDAAVSRFTSQRSSLSHHWTDNCYCSSSESRSAMTFRFYCACLLLNAFPCRKPRATHASINLFFRLKPNRNFDSFSCRPQQASLQGSQLNSALCDEATPKLR